MKAELKHTFQRFALELVLYAILVTAYYLLVLHFLGQGLDELYEHRRRLYAALALGLIVTQGLLLEVLTRVLLSWMTPRRRRE
ncbi:MAG TPA: hypothetical protein VL793_10545 [Patescibacteria group bacterium]|nr:hypothetical protein [Patescibacteria group bacterium]